MDVLSAISHPRVPRMVEAATEGDHPYLVSEILAGPTLFAWARSRGQDGPDLADACRVADAVLDVLAAVHAAGYVHCDLKAQNLVLLEGDPARAAILDFDLARSPGERSHLHVPATPGFDLSQAAAAFLLAIVGPYRPLYFAWASPLHRLPAVAQQLNGMSLHARRQVNAFFDKAFAPDPALRFQSVAEMRAALRGLAAATAEPQRGRAPAPT